MPETHDNRLAVSSISDDLHCKTKVLYVSCTPLSASHPHQSMAAVWLAGLLGSEKVLAVSPTDVHAEDGTQGPISEIKKIDLKYSGGSFRFYFGMLRELASLRWSLRRDRYVTYIHGANACPAAAVAFACFPRRLRVYHTQDFLEPGRHPVWEFFERWVARRSSVVISNEPNRARFLASHYRLREAPMVVPTLLPSNWQIKPAEHINRGSLTAELPPPARPHCKLIIAGGRYSDVRCTDVVVKAHSLLDERYVIVLTGVSSAEEERTKLRNAGATAEQLSRVVMLPFLNDRELHSVYEAGDIGLLLYRDSGIGNYYQCPGRLSQYLKAGLPCVTSRFVGLELLNLKYNLGLAVDPEDPQAVAKAIRDISERSDEDTKAERSRLRQLATTDLSYDLGGDQITKTITRLLNGDDS